MGMPRILAIRKLAVRSGILLRCLRGAGREFKLRIRPSPSESLHYREIPSPQSRDPPPARTPKHKRVARATTPYPSPFDKAFVFNVLGLARKVPSTLSNHRRHP